MDSGSRIGFKDIQSQKTHHFAPTQASVFERTQKSGSQKAPVRKKKAWNAVVKQLKVDINRYIAKYDFDVGRKICPLQCGENYREELQNTFKMTAMLEVIQLCSAHMSRGKK